MILADLVVSHAAELWKGLNFDRWLDTSVLVDHLRRLLRTSAGRFDMRAVEAAFFYAFDPSTVLDHGIHFNCATHRGIVLSSRCQESF